DMRDAHGVPLEDGVVHTMGMRNRKILPVASRRPGDQVTLILRPWEEVESTYGALKAGTMDDITLELDKPLYWGEPGP
ncbi:MAG: hypothetical protein O3C57_05985, partial [Verrucomicrobia bacterium]|nr:hypothetical protein [Verrucomicrobiota bacterium]